MALSVPSWVHPCLLGPRVFLSAGGWCRVKGTGWGGLGRIQERFPGSLRPSRAPKEKSFRGGTQRGLLQKYIQAFWRPRAPQVLRVWRGWEALPLHIFWLQKERNCWIAPCDSGGCPWTHHWVVFRAGTSFFRVVQAQLAPHRPVPLSERGSVPRAWPCRAVSARGHLGWVAVARFQRSPLGRVLPRPQLSAPAIPSSLAQTFPPGLSGTHLSIHPAPCSPFTALSPSLQPRRKGERTSALISPFHPLSAHL